MGCRIIMCTIIMSEELDDEAGGSECGFVVSVKAWRRCSGVLDGLLGFVGGKCIQYR